MARRSLQVLGFLVLWVVLGWAQTYGPGEIYYGGIRLQFSGRVLITGACSATTQPAPGMTQIQCQVPEGVAGTVELTATRTPAGAVNVRVESVPSGWPSSLWIQQLGQWVDSRSAVASQPVTPTPPPREPIVPPTEPIVGPITGKTDGEGKFTVPLPWLGTTASGRLLDPDGRPVSGRSFTLTLVPKGAALASAGDVGGFIFAVPGYADTAVTEFTLTSFFFLTTFLLGDVPLVAAELPWRENRPLTWDDFQGDPPEDAEEREEAAEIHMSLSYSWQARVWLDRASGKWKAHITAVTTANIMDRPKSWVLPAHRTPELLSHEQKHFDLNEVYRRLLDAALQKFVCTEVTGATKDEAEENAKKMLDETFDTVNKKCDEVQNQYDRETDHGRDADKQKEWDRKIAGWLADPTQAPQP